MNTYRYIVSGRVQGVWFRKSVQRAAEAEGFSGYVRNLPDGTVEAEVTCMPERLETFEAILRRGSSASRVDDIARSEGRAIHSGPFEVR
jgi:acylphosphatase